MSTQKQSYFQSTQTPFRFINIIETKRHLPYVPKLNESFAYKMDERKQRNYIFHKKRREKFSEEIDQWLNDPLFDMDGIVYEFPNSKADFLQELFDDFKYDYLTTYCYDIDPDFKSKAGKLHNIGYIEDRMKHETEVISETAIEDDLIDIIGCHKHNFNKDVEITEDSIYHTDNIETYINDEPIIDESLPKCEQLVYAVSHILWRLSKQKGLAYNFSLQKLRLFFSKFSIQIMELSTGIDVKHLFISQPAICKFIVEETRMLSELTELEKEAHEIALVTFAQIYMDNKKKLEKYKEENEENKRIRKEELEELAKKHDIKFKLLQRYNLQEYEDFREDERVVFVTEEELMDNMNDDEFANYKVSVSDVINSFYGTTRQILSKYGYEIKDDVAFKDDFLYFFYYLSDNDTEKLLKTALL
jgi:hypothetical protein